MNEENTIAPIKEMIRHLKQSIDRLERICKIAVERKDEDNETTMAAMSEVHSIHYTLSQDISVLVRRQIYDK